MKLLSFLILFIVGCSSSGQKFLDDSWGWSTTKYDVEGNILIEESGHGQIVKGRSRTIAPPFNAKAISGQQMTMQQKGDFWNVKMGSQNQLDGGDISVTIEALEKAMMKGVLESLAGGL